MFGIISIFKIKVIYFFKKISGLDTDSLVRRLGGSMRFLPGITTF